jgi:hypothetical protein
VLPAPQPLALAASGPSVEPEGASTVAPPSGVVGVVGVVSSLWLDPQAAAARKTARIRKFGSMTPMCNRNGLAVTGHRRSAVLSRHCGYFHPARHFAKSGAARAWSIAVPRSISEVDSVVMRARNAWMLGVCLLADPLALWQCSGVSPNLNLNGADDASGGNSSGASGGSSSSSGSGGGDNSSSSGGSDSVDGGTVDATLMGNDDAQVGDAAADTAPPCIGPDGGVPCTPGIVACGGPGMCTTAANACCQPNPPDGGAQGTCQPNSASCSNNDVKVQCEEAADCPSGYVCCEYFPAFATLGATSCMPSCANGWSQICRTHAECAADAGGPARCVLQTCGSSFGFGGGQRVTLEACAVGMTNGGALPYCMPN